MDVVRQRHIGRPKLEIDRDAVLRDRALGMSLNELARKYQVSKATIHKVVKEAAKQGGQKTPLQPSPETIDFTEPHSALLAG